MEKCKCSRQQKTNSKVKDGLSFFLREGGHGDGLNSPMLTNVQIVTGLRTTLKNKLKLMNPFT